MLAFFLKLVIARPCSFTFLKVCVYLSLYIYIYIYIYTYTHTDDLRRRYDICKQRIHPRSLLRVIAQEAVCDDRMPSLWHYRLSEGRSILDCLLCWAHAVRSSLHLLRQSLTGRAIS